MPIPVCRRRGNLKLGLELRRFYLDLSFLIVHFLTEFFPSDHSPILRELGSIAEQIQQHLPDFGHVGVRNCRLSRQYFCSVAVFLQRSRRGDGAPIKAWIEKVSK